MKKTLLLNADGTPISVIPLSVVSWQDAVKLIVLDKVVVVESYPDIISSPSRSMAKPSVIMAKKYQKNKHRVNYSRMAILYRDDMKCMYCGNYFEAKHLTLDHVTPKSHGGKKTFDNMVSSCRPCNSLKADKYKKPLIEPRVPTYFEIVNNRKNHPVFFPDMKWQKYLNWKESAIILSDRSQNSFKLEDFNDE